MAILANEGDVSSPFHIGEEAIQDRFGFKERLARTPAIRTFLMEQQTDFFGHLSYVVIGAADDVGQVWASILFGPERFIYAPDPQHLSISALPEFDDPLIHALLPGKPIAVLGIDLATRRRNRVNGSILGFTDKVTFEIEIEQSYGNCPQYIWPRAIDWVSQKANSGDTEELELSDERVERLIRKADTFFVASQHRDRALLNPGAVDVSHRGGQAGFMLITDGALLWPDYRGNFYFNTLGNLLLNPACGLLVPDFDTGDILQITGAAELVWSPVKDFEAAGGPSANCHVRLVPKRIVFRPGAIPHSWQQLGNAEYFRS